MADYDVAVLENLRLQTPTESEILNDLWQSIAAAHASVDKALKEAREKDAPALPEQFLILVTCANEEEQAQLLQQLTDEGLKCKALIS